MRRITASRTLATAFLLASTALTAPAFAQSAATPAVSAATNSSSGSYGNTLPTDIGTVRTKGTTTPDGVTGQDIGGGLMIQEDQPKTRSTVTRDYIAKQSPTANPYQLINLLPGVNTASTDAAGLNGGNITVRGMASNEIGLTIDGAPINDSGNFALYPQEYLDSPNIGQISIAPGYPDLDSPHVGATGGVINIYSKDPDKTAGGFISLSGGTRNLQNEFIRLETGEIGRFSGYVSYSNYSVDHWRGLGQDQRDHIDAKAVIQVRDASKITLSAIYNEEDNNSYLALSNAELANGGAFAAQNNLDRTFNQGGTVSGTGVVTQSKLNGYYKDYINPFKNLILSAPSTFALTDDLTLDVTPYFWYGFGNGGGVTALQDTGFYYAGTKITQPLNGEAAANGSKYLYYTPSITETFRPGIITKLNYQIGNNHLVGGVWLEDASQHQYGAATQLNANGSPINPYGDSNNLIIASGPLAGQKLEKRNQITNTYVTAIFAGDSISLLDDRLTVDIGVKQAFITRHGDNLVPSQPYNIPTTVNYNDSQTLPQAAVTYKLTDTQSVYVSIATTFKTPANYNLFGTYSLTSGAATAYTPPIPEKDETAIHVEVGHRYQGDVITSAISLFGYQFANRQLQTYVPDPASPGAFISATTNVGSTTSYGLDAEIGTRPINNLRPYASFELSHDVMDSNLPNNGKLGTATIADFLPTKGKYVPGAPSVIGAVGVDYDDGSWFGNFAVKYTGRQFGSYTNDDVIQGYARADAVAGYRFQDFNFLKAPQIRLNVYNLGNQVGLTSPYSITTNAHSTTGLKGSTISGSTPYYYVGQGFAAMLTLSSGF